MQRLAFAVALTLTLLASGAASAQSTTNKDKDTNPLIQYISTVEGVEASSGYAEDGEDVTAGMTYTMDVAGFLAGHFTAVFECTGSEPDPYQGNTILHGSWTMAVYVNNAYQGTLFGEIRTGTMFWKNDDGRIMSGSVRAELWIKGGTGRMEFAARQGFGAVDLNWMRGPDGLRETDPKSNDTSLPRLNGRLTLVF